MRPMLRLKPQASISAPTASATLSTAGSIGHRELPGYLLTHRRRRGVVTACTRVVTRTSTAPRTREPPVETELSRRRRLMISTISRCESPPDGRIVTVDWRPVLQLARGDREQRLDVDGDHELDAHGYPAGPGGRSSSVTWPSLRFFVTSCRLALIELDRDVLLILVRRREHAAGAHRQHRVARQHRRRSCESPTLDADVVRRDVEQRRIVGRFARERIPAYAAAPCATTSSGFAPLLGFLP